MPSPHLLKDLRLLHHVFCGAQPQIGGQFHELFEPVFRRSSQLAKKTLQSLCDELRADSKEFVHEPATSLPDLRLVLSPVAQSLGVQVGHDMRAGQLLCFYPGRIFLDNEESLPPGDKLFTNEYEGCHMDGKGWMPASWKRHELLGEPAATLWHGNRLAVGNLLNHPAPGMLPNCIPMPFAWPTWQALGQDSPAFWARLVPHVVLKSGRIVRTPSGGAGQQATFPAWPHMGMAFFSVRPISAGDELLINYRLSPPFPSWYTAVDDEALEHEVYNLQ